MSDLEIQIARASALQPVVQDDAGDLSSLAAAGSVTQKPSTAEAHRVLGAFGGGRDDVAGLVDRPGAGEMAGMRLAGIDHAFELGVRQQTLVDDRVRQQGTVGRLRWRDRGHRGRLDQRRRMRLCAGNVDRLECVGLIDRVGEPAAFLRHPVAQLVGKGCGRRAAGRDRSDRHRPGNRASRPDGLVSTL